ncbi:MAG: ZIP family metal transporter, partial [Thermoproteota archaeon]|nr:ZIP family metal transporter [Thermoproteota archaeon]
AYAGKSSTIDALFDTLAMFGGLAIGLLGLVFYETRFMKHQKKQRPSSTSSILSIKKGKNIPLFDNRQQDNDGIKGSSAATAVDIDADIEGGGGLQHQNQLIHETNAYKLSMMIAIGIGTHNFSEGLAIGQSFVSGAIGLALLLIIGFGSHNATEGFGIAGPLTGLTNRPKIRFIILLGLIGGGPTFLGTIIGSLWISNVAYILFLSIAGGALIYVAMLMYNSGRMLATNNIMMTGIFIGLCIGFITDLIITLGGA